MNLGYAVWASRVMTVLAALVLPVMVCPPVCQAQEMTRWPGVDAGWLEVDSASRLESVFQEAALSLQPEVRVRLAGDWARNAKEALQHVDWYNWADKYQLEQVERREGCFITFRLGYKDSTRMYAAVKRPELMARLSADERKALEMVQTALRRLIKSGMSDMEKIQAVHDWIVNWTTYDLNVKGREDATTLLLKRRGVCDAYSRTTWLMLNLIGIPCKFVLGDAKGSHVWNLVYADGQWYHLDVTWDDPICRPEILSHGFFCLSDKEMADTHRWNARLYPPTQDGKPLYFIQRKRYFRMMDEAFWKSVREAYEGGESTYVAYLASFGSRKSMESQINAMSRSGLPITSWSRAKGNKGELRLTFASKGERQPVTPPVERGFQLPTGGVIDFAWLKEVLPDGAEIDMEDLGLDAESVKQRGKELMEEGSRLMDEVEDSGIWDSIRGWLP